MPKNQKSVDALTGLPGRDEFERSLSAIIRAKGEHSPVSLAFFDIDDFMKINQNNGHDRGDIVIIEIVKLFQNLLPPDRGTVFRIGGDEFAVVLKSTEKEEAFLRLEKARGGVMHIDAFRDIEPLPAISIGVAT